MTIEVLRGDDQAPIAPLLGKTVAVIGYGNQGAAHALNLRDSGIKVIVGAREGQGLRAAINAGFDVKSIANAAAQAELVIVALPDETQAEILSRDIVPNLRADATLGFIHGFTVHFGLLPTLPDGLGVVMVAPKGPGKTLRDRFTSGQGIPCLLAVHRESSSNTSRSLAIAWANAIGSARAGIILTTFRDETQTDLFGEQAVLCGGMTALVLAAFETLVAAGYPPELAYLECCHEVKQVADLMYERGIAGMMKAISNTAEFGAYAAAPIIADDATRARMKSLLQNVQDGAFARMIREDYSDGFEWFASERKRIADHPIEAAGETVRSLMPWLKPDGTDSNDASIQRE